MQMQGWINWDADEFKKQNAINRNRTLSRKYGIFEKQKQKKNKQTKRYFKTSNILDI